VIDTIAESTARLIVNRASYHLKRAAMAALIDTLRAAIQQGTQMEIDA
jgi:ATP phosphoribosyltransferase